MTDQCWDPRQGFGGEKGGGSAPARTVLGYRGTSQGGTRSR